MGHYRTKEAYVDALRDILEALCWLFGGWSFGDGAFDFN